jgi:hypothetical protein
MLTKKDNGVWYKTVGTGGTFTASNCFATTLNTLISVFTGTCTSPSTITGTCIVLNDDFCGPSGQSSVSWLTAPGTVYLILVRGYGGATGTFNLLLEATLVNDACASATAILPGAVVPGITITGSNLGATVADASNPSTGCTTATGKSQPREPFPPARSHVTDVLATC